MIALALLQVVLLVLLQTDVCQAAPSAPSATCFVDGEDGCDRPVATPCSFLPLPTGDSAAPVAVGVQQVQDDDGTGRELEYYLLGSPVAHSPSPLLHNAGFAACGLKHLYRSRETPSVQDVTAVLRDSPSFGGASVTIPLKETIIPLLDRLGSEAAAIGAVNTVVRTSTGELVGENTDYLGILYPVKAALHRRRSRRADGGREKMGIALVVGAGGTARAAAFAARELGLGVFVWNRSHHKAAKLAADFKGMAVESMEEAVGSATGDWTELSAVISTVPIAAGIHLPKSLLELQPVVLEASYTRNGEQRTPLQQTAIDAGCEVIDGRQMLVAQGIAQWEMWTGLEAPMEVMRAAVFDETSPSGEAHFVQEKKVKSSHSQVVMPHLVDA